jgi:CDP-glucose 4,6-dehydratase
MKISRYFSENSEIFLRCNSLRRCDAGSRRILITGGSGFVGTWLAEHFVSEGAFVVSLSAGAEPESRFVKDGVHEKVAHVVGSVADFAELDELIGEHDIDTVLHLAAVSVEGAAFASPLTAFDVNIRGTYNILEVCRVHADRVRAVVIASSDKAYGDSPSLPYTEDLPLQGRHPYDVSKSCADMLARTYAHCYDLPVVVGRFGNIFGAGDVNWSRLIPGTIRRLLEGGHPVIRVPKEGEFKRDFIYIKDVVRAYTALLNGLEDPRIRGHAFNFAMSGSWTVREVVETIQPLLHREHVKPVVVPQQHGEILHQYVSIEKARRVLGWSPEHTLADGLRELIPWYRGILDREALSVSA